MALFGLLVATLIGSLVNLSLSFGDHQRLYNASLIPDARPRQDVEALAVPATEIADRLGSTLLANMVMLGAYIEWTDLLAPQAARVALETLIKRKEMLASDIAAVEAGIDWVKTSGLQPVHRCGSDGVT